MDEVIQEQPIPYEAIYTSGSIGISHGEAPVRGWQRRKGGREEGRKGGRKEGRKERRNEGMKERRNEGTKEGRTA